MSNIKDVQSYASKIWMLPFRIYETDQAQKAKIYKIQKEHICKNNLHSVFDKVSSAERTIAQTRAWLLNAKHAEIV